MNRYYVESYLVTKDETFGDLYQVEVWEAATGKTVWDRLTSIHELKHARRYAAAWIREQEEHLEALYDAREQH